MPVTDSFIKGDGDIRIKKLCREAKLEPLVVEKNMM
jgi:hypothetical protein